MIDINLLNQQSGQQSTHDPSDMPTEYGAIHFGDENRGPEGSDLEGIIKTLAIFIPTLCLYFFQGHQVSKVKTELEKSQAQVTQLEKQAIANENLAHEAKKILDRKVLIERQIEGISRLFSSRLAPVKALEAIQTSIPEKAWLTDLTNTRNKLTLRGLAVGNEEVNLFLERLNATAAFSEVIMTNSAMQVIDKKTFKSFQIDLKINERI